MATVSGCRLFGFGPTESSRTATSNDPSGMVLQEKGVEKVKVGAILCPCSKWDLFQLIQSMACGVKCDCVAKMQTRHANM